MEKIILIQKEEKLVLKSIITNTLSYQTSYISIDRLALLERVSKRKFILKDLILELDTPRSIQEQFQFYKFYIRITESVYLPSKYKIPPVIPLHSILKT